MRPFHLIHAYLDEQIDRIERTRKGPVLFGPFYDERDEKVQALRDAVTRLFAEGIPNA